MQVATPSGNDAARDGGIEAKRIADRQHPIANPRGIAVAPTDIGQGLVHIDFEQCQIGFGVAPDDSGGMPLPVLKTHRHLFSVLADVVLGDDNTVGIDNKTRAGRFDRYLRHAKKSFQQLVERSWRKPRSAR
jgi:hypothetical protein